MLILQFRGRLGAGSWYTVLESFPRTWNCTIGKGIRKREILRHQSELNQYGGLVPRYVFVVKSVPPDVDH